MNDFKTMNFVREARDKIYEETKRGTLEELVAYFSKKAIKGEIVIVIEGKDAKNELLDIK